MKNRRLLSMIISCVFGLAVTPIACADESSVTAETANTVSAINTVLAQTLPAADDVITKYGIGSPYNFLPLSSTYVNSKYISAIAQPSYTSSRGITYYTDAIHITISSNSTASPSLAPTFLQGKVLTFTFNTDTKYTPTLKSWSCTGSIKDGTAQLNPKAIPNAILTGNAATKGTTDFTSILTFSADTSSNTHNMTCVFS